MLKSHQSPHIHHHIQKVAPPTYFNLLKLYIDKVLHDFSDLSRNVQHIIAVLFPSASAEQRLSVLEQLSNKYPTHPAVAYHYGALLIQLMDYDGGLSIWDKVFHIPPQYT
jgi:hypothetical protein